MNLIKSLEEYKKNLTDSKMNFMPKNKKLSPMNPTYSPSINPGLLKLSMTFYNPKIKIKETLYLIGLLSCLCANLCPFPKNSVKITLKYFSKYLPLTATISLKPISLFLSETFYINFPKKCKPIQIKFTKSKKKKKFPKNF